MIETVLETNNLTKQYGAQKALDNVSITVRKGDIYGLVGQNGAGKTTLIRLVTALAFPTAGEIKLLGKVGRQQLLQARRRVGSIVEMPAFYGNLTARSNLEYFRIQRGIPNREVVDDALRKVNLTDTGSKKFKNFSLGMKQRLGIALSILNNPDFIILDEPVNGLDPTGIIEIRQMFKDLQDKGITILISSHILSELSLIATRYGFIHRGRLVREIDDAELKESCKTAMRITVNDTAKAAVVLEQEAGVQEYKIISDTEIRVYECLDKPAIIMNKLFESGRAVSGLNMVSDTLEDFYISLVKEAEANA
jgi:ABC-2 type transport system ATP-binding protein